MKQTTETTEKMEFNQLLECARTSLNCSSSWWVEQDKLLNIFNDHNPFKIRNEDIELQKTLCSFVTGIIADKDVNCYDAESVGIRKM